MFIGPSFVKAFLALIDELLKHYREFLYQHHNFAFDSKRISMTFKFYSFKWSHLVDGKPLQQGHDLYFTPKHLEVDALIHWIAKNVINDVSAEIAILEVNPISSEEYLKMSLSQNSPL